MSWLCSIPLAASLFGACAPPAPLAVGYVEGEFVLVAPIEVAEIRAVPVRRGQHVAKGDLLAELIADDAEIAVAQAEAAAGQASAQLADLKLGKRPEEIAVLEAALSAARADAREAQRVADRAADLLKRGIATQADHDQAATALEMAQARVDQAAANLEVGKLPARVETINAAESQLRQAQANLDQAKWRLTRRRLEAPATGRIGDVLREGGEIAGPTAPVLSLLPDGGVKLKLYVGETSFSSIAVGSKLAVRCDGCPAGLSATVSYVSPDPEFTPPVIYSLENRQKLVYLVEARPDASSSVLQPGQIVDVSLGDD